MFRGRPARVNRSRLLVACFLCLGFWQLGQGTYMPAKAWLAQELMQRAWRKAEMGDENTAPWPWADTYPVARMTAKNGDIELIILEGGSGRTLAFAPGHLSASVLPGQPGNSIIAGPAFPGFGTVLAEAGRAEELIVASLNFTQLSAWYDWLPWREWRLGAQLPVTRLVAEEFAAIVAKAER